MRKNDSPTHFGGKGVHSTFGVKLKYWRFKCHLCGFCWF